MEGSSTSKMSRPLAVLIIATIGILFSLAVGLLTIVSFNIGDRPNSLQSILPLAWLLISFGLLYMKRWAVYLYVAFLLIYSVTGIYQSIAPSYGYGAGPTDILSMTVYILVGLLVGIYLWTIRKKFN